MGSRLGQSHHRSDSIEFTHQNGGTSKACPPPKVEFNPKSETIQRVLKESKSLWAGKTAVVAMGDLLTLGAFSLVPPITNTLVGAFSTEREALDACKAKQPDLLYATEHLEQGYGIPLAIKAKEVSPNTRVLLFLHRENQEVVRDALDAHIDGIAFVSSIGKGVDGDLFKSLNAIANGSTYYPKEVREMVGFKKSQILNELSAREKEVLEALCQGMSNKEMAESMFVSTETIKSHVSTVISKLGVKDRTQAVIACIRAGM